MLANETPECKGALSGAIIGELAGLYETWKHGWKGSVGKTRKTCCLSARLGFMISPYIHMQMVKTKSGTLADWGTSSYIYIKRDSFEDRWDMP